jgi:hypothetical protein
MKQLTRLEDGLKVKLQTKSDKRRTEIRNHVVRNVASELDTTTSEAPEGWTARGVVIKRHLGSPVRYR